jgi:uncharacterized protein YndB with AHSA1/START domain
MSDDRKLVIRRILDAPRSRVFAAWIDEKQAARWWGPKGFTTVANKMDVRVGGEWQRRMRSPEGSEHHSRGFYREIVEPERLVFTFSWDQGGVQGHGPETLVTLTFADLSGDRTELTLTQELFETAAARDAHYHGWSNCLDRLVEYLAALDAQGAEQ